MANDDGGGKVQMAGIEEGTGEGRGSRCLGAGLETLEKGGGVKGAKGRIGRDTEPSWSDEGP